MKVHKAPNGQFYDQVVYIGYVALLWRILNTLALKRKICIEIGLFDLELRCDTVDTQTQTKL